MKFVFCFATENRECGLSDEGANGGNAPPQNFGARTVPGRICDSSMIHMVSHYLLLSCHSCFDLRSVICRASGMASSAVATVEATEAATSVEI